MNNKFKVGLIGCGVIANTHLSYLRECELVDIVALCDTKLDKAAALKEKYELSTSLYEDYKEMLNSGTIDSVHITSPHYLHAEMAIEALRKNINVVLEKPICITEEEIEKLLIAEKESKARITVCFQNRMNLSTVLGLKEAHNDGGALSAYGSLFWFRSNEYYTESDWRGKWATEGGGTLINQAIHTLDLLCQFLGKPTAVKATVQNLDKVGVIEVEDTASGIIYFENGKCASFHATTSFHGKGMTSVVVETKNKRIEINSPNRLYVSGEKIEFNNEDIKYVGKPCYGNGHKTLINNFYSALNDGGDMPVTLTSATYALRILLAAYKSNGELIKI